MNRRALLMAIFIYVTLDLSLASMPGAFVFEAAESVESPHRGHGRGATDLAVRAAAGASVPAPLPRAVTRPLLLTPAAARCADARPRCLPRAAVDTPVPSDDPH